MIDRLAFCVSAVPGLLGVSLGFLSASHNHALVPNHVHIVMMMSVMLFLTALHCRIVPGAASPAIARTQVLLAIAGSVLYPAGVAIELLGTSPSTGAVEAVVGTLVVASASLFAMIVFRTGGYRPEFVEDCANHLVSTIVEKVT